MENNILIQLTSKTDRMMVRQLESSQFNKASAYEKIYFYYETEDLNWLIVSFETYVLPHF